MPFSGQPSLYLAQKKMTGGVSAPLSSVSDAQSGREFVSVDASARRQPDNSLERSANFPAGPVPVRLPGTGSSSKTGSPALPAGTKRQRTALEQTLVDLDRPAGTFYPLEGFQDAILGALKTLTAEIVGLKLEVASGRNQIAALEEQVRVLTLGTRSTTAGPTRAGEAATEPPKRSPSRQKRAPRPAKSMGPEKTKSNPLSGSTEDVPMGVFQFGVTKVVPTPKLQVIQPAPQAKAPAPVSSGKVQAAPLKPSYKEVAARALIGHRKTSIVLLPPTEIPIPATAEDVAPMNPEILADLKQTLTQETRPAPVREVKALRFDRLVNRKKYPASKWRALLKENGIFPIAILFPQLNSLELAVPADQEAKTISFFRHLGRDPVNANPLHRRDGKPEALPQSTLKLILEQRIQMLKFERSVAASRYIEETLCQGLLAVEAKMQTTLRILIAKIQKEKGLSFRPRREIPQPIVLDV